jgi:hypothetical protein
MDETLLPRANRAPGGRHPETYAYLAATALILQWRGHDFLASALVRRAPPPSGNQIEEAVQHGAS